MSGDPDQEFFADGIAEDVLTVLSKQRWLFVIARNSSFTYRGKSVDIEQYGPPLPEENRGLYKAANKRDRRNEHHMAALLGRLGAYRGWRSFTRFQQSHATCFGKRGFHHRSLADAR